MARHTTLDIHYNTRAEKTKNGHKSENDDDDDGGGGTTSNFWNA
jgi:hypothetical protein